MAPNVLTAPRPGEVLRCVAVNKRVESRETRADRIVIMHPVGMAVVQQNLQSFSTVHSF